MTQGTLSAISRNIDTYLSDLDKLTFMPYSNERFMSALKSKANKEYYKKDAYAEFIATLDINTSLTVSLNNIRQDIRSIILIASDGSTFFYDRYIASSSIKPQYDFKAKSWYKKAIDADGRVVFIGFHPQDYISRTSVANVFSVARVIKEPDTQKHLGLIMADADNIIIDRILKDANFGVSSIVSIFDEQNNLIYSTKEMSEDIIKQILEGKKLIKAENDSYLPVSQYIDRADWNMVVLLSNSETASKIRAVFLSAVVFIFAQIVLAFFLFYLSSRSITKRFAKIRNVMNEVKNGNMKARFASRAKDEIAIVGNELNNMIEKINDLIDREYRAVLNRRNAEYYALQSQIQPHFLYNTLNGFIGLNRLGEKETLEKAIFSLTGMLRYILDHKEWTTIKEEFLLIERYCMLQKIRFKDRFQFKISLDKETENVKIPKLLVQPLVENAIIHGIEPVSEKCTLLVSAGLNKEPGKKCVNITVIDNGAGFREDEENKIKKVGLRNVKERLELAFSNASFTIISEINKGTQALISIPLEEDSHEYNHS